MKSSESVHISKKQLSMSKYREDKNAKIKKKPLKQNIFHHINAILQNISIMKDDCDRYLFFPTTDLKQS